jgi:uncharacterized protein
MSLQQRISDELKASMLARKAERTNTLRALKSAMGYTQIEKKVEFLGDADVLIVIQREAKKRKDSVEEFEKGGREDLASIERGELLILAEFLPKPLSSEEIEALVREAIASTGATSKKDMGAVMKVAQAQAGGRADGKALSALVTRLLP